MNVWRASAPDQPVIGDQRVVVTGGAGFIGGNLVAAMAATPWISEITVVDDLSSGDLRNLDSLPVRFIEGSVEDPALLDDAFAGASSVVHLAAVPSVPRSVDDPVRSHEANATGTLQVLEAARRVASGVPHVVVVSSSSVYGVNPHLPKSEDLRPMPVSPYAVSKLAAESYVAAYSHCYSMELLAFRFFNVFGPLQPPGHAYAAAIPTFVNSALREEPVHVHGDGRQTRDFTYVDTVVATLIDAVARRVCSPDPVNLAFGSRVALVDVIAELEVILGRPIDVVHDAPRLGDVRDSQADPTRLRSMFPGIEPTPLDVGLRTTAAWMAATLGTTPITT